MYVRRFSKHLKDYSAVPVLLQELFHFSESANQKEALFPESCPEVEAERRILPQALKESGKVHVEKDC